MGSDKKHKIIGSRETTRDCELDHERLLVTVILSKHWGYQQVWKLLRPLLFWPGDTLNILELESVKMSD
jgi:hypothetical protein